jgi:crossover junction endodeoxyribonuclease RuvC
MAPAIRIIGIDPGLRRTGWGVIESDGVRLVYVASGLITSEAEDDLGQRLVDLHRGLVAVFDTHDPIEAAVEETFVNDNGRATLKLGQARGIAMLVPALTGIKVAEYAPNQIKKTVTGAGHADKRQVTAMVGMLLPKAAPKSPDEADALAIAICHAHQRRSRNILAALTAKVANR